MHLNEFFILYLLIRCSIIKLNCWEFIFIFKMKLEFVVAQAPNAKKEKVFRKVGQIGPHVLLSPHRQLLLGSIKRAL